MLEQDELNDLVADPARAPNDWPAHWLFLAGNSTRSLRLHLLLPAERSWLSFPASDVSDSQHDFINPNASQRNNRTAFQPAVRVQGTRFSKSSRIRRFEHHVVTLYSTTQVPRRVNFLSGFAAKSALWS